MKALDHLLHHLHLHGVLYCHSELRGRWGIELPEVPDTSLFHILISGACLVEHKGYTQRLLPGDFMFVPRGAGEVLKSDPEAPVKALFDYPYTAINGSYEVLKWGDTGPVTRLLCGVVRLEDPSAHYLLKALPEILHLPHARSNHPQWLSQTVEIIMQEAEHPQLGGEALLTRLADVLVIQGIRHWVQENAQATGWLLALEDDRIGHALQLIHDAPETPWTLEKLAQRSGMSRSAFAQRFKHLVGETMLNYLTQWRMRLALSRLRQGQKISEDWVEQLGYTSEAAFRRAFKKTLGLPPGEYLQQKLPTVSELMSDLMPGQ